MIKGEKIDQIMEEEKYNYRKMKTRGVLVNFDHESEIWLKIFKKIRGK